WWAAPREVEETLRRAGEHYMGSLHASEHAAISLFPLLALCDRGDIGGISYSFQPQVGSGAVFIYDGHPGGVGIAARVFEDLPDLLARVLTLVEGCPCETGCPSCIQSPKCGNGNRPLDKPGAARSIRLLLGTEAPAIPWGAPQILDLRALAEGSPHPPAPSPAPPSTPSPGEGERTALLLGIPPFPLFRGLSDPHTILFDLETLRGASDVGGWANIHRMGLALGVVCHLEEGRFEVFGEGEVQGLIESLRGASLVIGYNVRRFDYRVLSGYTGEDYNRVLPTLDLLEDVARRLGFRVGMGHLAQETLGLGKSADGLQSLQWVREGRLDLVEQYCRRDVEILRDIYLYGRREGCLFYRNRRRDVRLKFYVEW
ncbi:MAG TPA: Zn-binding domain-containing protein, partial [Thermoanaerobaculia bacterium]|nr:Zn-binding domain-containing protein [Thermoanaerobaculia bacterium]